MAHFARIDENNIVKQVIVVANGVINDLPFPESEPIGVEFCQSLFGGNWLQTSYNNHFRVRFAGLDFTYDAAKDAFIRPQPYPSWILNPDTTEWEAPVSHPDDGNLYIWNETTLSWVEVPPPPPSV